MSFRFINSQIDFLLSSNYVSYSNHNQKNPARHLNPDRATDILQPYHSIVTIITFSLVISPLFTTTLVVCSASPVFLNVNA